MLKMEDRSPIEDLQRRGITISDIARITGHECWRGAETCAAA